MLKDSILKWRHTAKALEGAGEKKKKNFSEPQEQDERHFLCQHVNPFYS